MDEVAGIAKTDNQRKFQMFVSIGIIKPFTDLFNIFFFFRICLVIADNPLLRLV